MISGPASEFTERKGRRVDGDRFQGLAKLAVHAEKILHAAFVRYLVVQFEVSSGHALHLVFHVIHVVLLARLR
jgi:hypothetical protein